MPEYEDNGPGIVFGEKGREAQGPWVARLFKAHLEDEV